ncbi:ribonuclease G [Parvibaculum indicum]|uniref:Rne/Rng family ribonuclease n=1 Tax=Parvibaculum indicum TaxID=562969 RepID=UPI0014200488|nr:Rne/Rng family ribonuclease [Parvibaculum indicum]NIJ43015.1 ribonuclease G [Parvibaculum indicum]
MSEEVLINVGPGETRVAVVERGRPVEFFLERTMADALKDRTGRAGHSVIGNIFLGRVQRVLPGMQAAFVEIGLERAGFLGAREARCLCELTGLDEGTLPPISACVTEGQEILVQAVKDPISEKGARLSANVTLPGRLLVLVPNQSGVALSRRIEDEPERERLTALVEEMVERFNACGVTGEPAGFIVRTAAIGATAEEIAADARQLAEEWRQVRDRQKRSSPPSVVFHDLDPVAKTLRDCVNADTERVLIDDAEAFAEAKHYCKRAMPEMLDRVQLFNGPGALFALYDVDGQIETALEPRVELPSGGWITIETTEALTAIDVNSGRYTAATGLEETSARINLEAVEEIVHQLRLRGTGGIVVIDFIHLNEPGNIEKVIDALETGFARDRVPTQISAMSEFGLVEMTRKRVREPLDKLLTEPAYANCRPRRKTCATVANDLLRRIQREAAGAPGRTLVAHASTEVVDWLERGNPYLLERLSLKIAAAVSLVPEPDYSREKIDVGVLQ